MGFLRIAQAQIDTTVGDLGGNTKKICRFIARAKDERADVVTFPELAVSGYPPEDLLLRPRFVADCEAALAEIARAASGITALVGFPDFDEDHVYNAAALISNKKILTIYHKIELPNYGVFDEKRYFAPGALPPIFSLDGVGILITICEDIWIP
jgi:NAD+ synthase (glutamine-hydrolysing)